VHPYYVQSTSKSNDAVESVINQSLVNIAKSDTNEKGREKQLLINQKKRTKLQKFRDFIGDNAGWIELVANVARASLTGGQSA
jgi:hypothetical protein